MSTYSSNVLSTLFMAPNSKKCDGVNQQNQELVMKSIKSDMAFKIVKISKNKLDRILKKECAAKYKQKSCFDDNDSGSKKEENLNLKKEWDQLPQQVKEEVIKVTTEKKLQRSIKNCSCIYSNDLIQLYHNAGLLREKADKIEAMKVTFKPQIACNYFDPFKSDNSTHNSLMKEIQTQKCGITKLRKIYEKVKEKLKLLSKESLQNQMYLKEVIKKMQQVDEITKEFVPDNNMFHLNENQQAVKIDRMNQAIRLEEEEMCKAKKKIEMRLNRKEEWKVQEKCYDRKRSKERQIDTLLILKSMNLMENYIEELKSRIK